MTGEYDWSTTPEMSKATADKIKGANFKAMEGLGHFPATENPNRFVSLFSESYCNPTLQYLMVYQLTITQVPYLIDAIDWIQKTRK